ncbi:MAG: EAL domain-containing protein [Ruminococcus sp.]|uniref:EAL domain-containing protein n=1 Tax=Ruminococcus sp. TaxID=41978 RepID=UPI0025FCE375|nr:EAL domain-containing protein [Ruminococcus sp.]MBR5682811.1 EAL domain-containing protein [Ruminococcus sp.]
MVRSRNRLALFVGQADEAYQSRFISGFNKKALADDNDVCIFSMYRKYQDTPENEKGESNIFSLMNPDSFDGAVILKDSIQTENAGSELEKRLKETFDKPIVVIEKESDLFPSIYIDGYSAVFDIITHLIEVHGCRDIAFVSGKKNHKHSKERLQAYLDAMEKAGLPVSEKRIIYGDYWYQSGEVYAEQLLSQGGSLPDAVACANDQMAIGLCKALTARGIRIPEDIAVVGYDSTYEGQTSPCTVTSALIPAKDFGEYAYDFLMKRMKGEIPDDFALSPEVVLGESCGCHNENMPTYQIKRRKWETEISEEGFNSVFNTMESELISQVSLTEYLNSVYSYIYQLGDIREFHLCLDSKWENIGNNVSVKNNGYNESMIHAVRYYSDHKNNMTGIESRFLSADMLPDLGGERDSPAVYIFTPLFFGEDCFGYAAVRYKNEMNSYDEVYRRWIDSVNRGFEVLKRNICLKNAQKRLERIRNSKFTIYSYAYDSLDEKEKEDYSLVAKILDENLFDYHFQPIIDAKSGDIYAYEALMRARTETNVSPLSIIKYATMQERLFDVERSTFLNVLRIVSENKEALGSAKVFINSIPGVMVGDGDLSDISSHLEKIADRIVIELTEEAELNDDDLMKLKQFYEKLNIDIAVDDYGTGYSNVSNLLRYMPNYVKIDHSLISDINNQPRKQHFVREIIDFCHDNNIKALAEGVETTEEMRIAINLGADLIQGFYMAVPSPEIIHGIDDKRRSEIQRYYQERIDGEMKKVYYAGKTSRVPLAQLVRDGYSEIVVGADEMVYKDILIIGIPHMKTNIHLRVESGYSGRITLEEVYFTNIKKRPCIELGENTDTAVVLLGTNTMFGSGIKVPESSRLTLEGRGDLEIELNAAEFYGIGNDHYSRHGELIFDQDGSVNINCHGQRGIAIGSGLGGAVCINRGEYNIRSNNEECVGIGALTGKVDLSVSLCQIEADFIVTSGVLIGSLYNDVSVKMKKTSIYFYGFGRSISVIGSIKGKKAEIDTNMIGAVFNVTSDDSTLFGTLDGASVLNISDSALKLESTGKQALLFGGNGPDTEVELLNSDTQAVVHSAIGKDTLAPDEKIRIINGRRRIMINGEEIERPIIYDYT